MSVASPLALFAVARRVRSRLGAVLGFSLVFGALEAAVVAPLAALLLRLFLARHGSASVGNFEIAQFLLSVPGALAVLTVGTVTVAGAYLHVAGLLRILGDPPSTSGGTIRGLLRDSQRLLRLCALQIGAGLLVAAPLVFAALFAVKAVFGDRDLNGLLALKPPTFWYGVAAGAVPLLLLVGALLWLALRWLFALPILLEAPAAWPFEALRESAARTRGRASRHLGALVATVATATGLSVVVQGVVALLGGLLLDAVGSRLAVALAVTAVVLVAWAATVAVTNWLGLALLAGQIDRLHRAATARPPASALPVVASAPASTVWKALGAVGVVTALTVFAGWRLVANQRPDDAVELTAHRMGARAAPENTLAALRQAIVDRAEWAELDVQLTSDGALVVLHDFDLVRIGGPAKKVADATLAEIRAIDVGRGLRMPAFAGERVPTLDEVIATAGDRIRLNIELKPPTPASVAPLTDAVLAAVRRAGVVGRCHFCSQSYEAMRRAKRAEPGLEVGFIAGAALGDLTGLEVDFLMVNAGLATRALVRRAHAQGMKVHPWTVNDPDAVPRLVDAGVDNIITDDPVALRARLEEIRALDLPERLLLRVRGILTD